MKIIIVTSEFGEEAGGLSFSCYSYSKMLRELGHNVSIVSSVDNQNYLVKIKDFNIINSEIIISEGGYKKELKNHLFFKAHLDNVTKEIKLLNIDYIIAFGAGNNGLFASELSNNLGVELIVLLRGSEINLSLSDINLRNINYYCLSRAYMVIALSKELIERSKGIYYSANILYKVIPNSITKPINIQIEVEKDNIVILGCGARNLNEKKGIANLISIIYHLKRSSNKQFKLELIGRIDSDLLDNYLLLCNQLDVLENVNFVGELNRYQFIDRMRDWNFYVQTSFGEGFSNSVADYLSLGKAFVLSDSGFIAETMSKEHNEIVFSDNIPANMAQTILNIISKDDINNYYKTAYNSILELTDDNYLRKVWMNIFAKKIKTTPCFNLFNNNVISVVFHDISLKEYTNIDTPEKSFKEFVDKVAKMGYKLCSSNDYFKSSKRNNLIICTFDDAYVGVLTYALPILKRYDFSATIFVCYDYIGESNDWNFKDTKSRKHLSVLELQMLKSEGWEIGSHGLTHKSLLRLTDSELYNEIKTSKSKLQELFGSINTYAYPYGDYNDFIKSKVEELYYCAYSLTKGGTLLGADNHQVRRYFISEFSKAFDLAQF